MAAFTTSADTSAGSDAPHPVRTRYAPSPTGFPHIGNYRTAIFVPLRATRQRQAFAEDDRSFRLGM